MSTVSDVKLWDVAADLLAEKGNVQDATRALRAWYLENHESVPVEQVADVLATFMPSYLSRAGNRTAKNGKPFHKAPTNVPTTPKGTETTPRVPPGVRTDVLRACNLGRFNSMRIGGKPLADCTREELRADAALLRAQGDGCYRQAEFEQKLAACLAKGQRVRDKFISEGDIDAATA
jgi:hypothetical protein